MSATDINGDGKTDVLATVPTGVEDATAETELQLFLSNGDGTFAAPTTITTAANPGLIFYSPLLLADFNKDGKLDLLCLGETTAAQAELALSLGNGDGTFAAPTILNISGGDAIRNSGFAAADFDGDGNVDIALLNAEDISGIYYGKGDGTFTSVPSNGLSYPKDLINLAVGGAAVAINLTHGGKADILAGDVVLLNIYGSAPVSTTPAATTTALTASAATITAGGSVTFTATITGASGSTGTPTGTVTFLDGTTTLGTGTLSASGVATYSTSKLATGAHSITAQYGGDSNFAASTSTAVTVTVQAPVPASFTVSASPASLSITAGATGTTTVSVTPAGGFAQASNLRLHRPAFRGHLHLCSGNRHPGRKRRNHHFDHYHNRRAVSSAKRDPPGWDDRLSGSGQLTTLADAWSESCCPMEPLLRAAVCLHPGRCIHRLRW